MLYESRKYVYRLIYTNSVHIQSQDSENHQHMWYLIFHLMGICNLVIPIFKIKKWFIALIVSPRSF